MMDGGRCISFYSGQMDGWPGLVDGALGAGY